MDSSTQVHWQQLPRFRLQWRWVVTTRSSHVLDPHTGGTDWIGGREEGRLNDKVSTQHGCWNHFCCVSCHNRLLPRVVRARDDKTKPVAEPCNDSIEPIGMLVRSRLNEFTMRTWPGKMTYFRPRNHGAACAAPDSGLRWALMRKTRWFVRQQHIPESLLEGKLCAPQTTLLPHPCTWRRSVILTNVVADRAIPLVQGQYKRSWLDSHQVVSCHKTCGSEASRMDMDTLRKHPNRRETTLPLAAQVPHTCSSFGAAHMARPHMARPFAKCATDS